MPLKEVLKIHRNTLLNIIYAPITLFNYYFHCEVVIISVDEEKIKRFYKEHKLIKPTYVFN